MKSTINTQTCFQVLDFLQFTTNVPKFLALFILVTVIEFLSNLRFLLFFNIGYEDV